MQSFVSQVLIRIQSNRFFSLLNRYIATRSMILIMYVQNRATIRSVFSKASDLPITLERLNSTTYVYATVRKHGIRTKPFWMFNFLYFTGKESNDRLFVAICTERMFACLQIRKNLLPSLDIQVEKKLIVFVRFCLAFDVVSCTFDLL